MKSTKLDILSKRRIQIIIALAISTTLVGAFFFHVAQVGTPGSRYDFENSTEDVGLKKNNGLNHYATFVSGIDGYALHLNGEDGYVEVPNNYDLAAEGVTVSAHILSYIPKGNQHSIIISDADGPNPKKGFTLRFGYGNDLRFVIGDGENSFGTAPVNVAEFPAHVIGSYDGKYVSLYVNGELKSRAPASKISYSNGPIGIGGDPAAGGKYFNGTIDEVKIFEKGLDLLQVTFSPEMRG